MKNAIHFVIKLIICSASMLFCGIVSGREGMACVLQPPD